MKQSPVPQPEGNYNSIKGLRRAIKDDIYQTDTSGNLSINSKNRRSPLSINIRPSKGETITDIMDDTRDQKLLMESFQADPQRIKIEALISDIDSTIRLIEIECGKKSSVVALGNNISKLKIAIDSILSQNKYKDMLIGELAAIKPASTSKTSEIQALHDDLAILSQKHDHLKYQHEISLALINERGDGRLHKIDNGLLKIQNQQEIILGLEIQVKNLERKNKQLGSMLVQAEQEKLELGNVVFHTIEADEKEGIKDRFRNFSFGIQPNIEGVNKEKVRELKFMADDLKRRMDSVSSREKIKSGGKKHENSPNKLDRAGLKKTLIELIQSLDQKIQRISFSIEYKSQMLADLSKIEHIITFSTRLDDTGNNNNNTDLLLSKVKDLYSLIQNQNILLKLTEDQNVKLIDLLTKAQNRYLSKTITDEGSRRAVYNITEELAERRDIYFDMVEKLKIIMTQ